MKAHAKRSISLLLTLVLVISLFCTAFSFSASALSYSGSASYRSGRFYTALTKVTLTGNQRTDIVNVAKSQIGYQEGNYGQLSGTVRGNRNYTEYGRWYGMQDQWCAMFVSWCANVARVSTSVVPSHAWTPSGLSFFRNRGQAYSRATVANGGYVPQAGDIVYFRSSSTSESTNHIGIVTGYSGSTLYTIEGNTSSATVSTDGGAVAAKSYSIYNTYVVYICRPSYSGTNINTGGSNSGSSSSTNTTADMIKAAVFNADYYAIKYSDLKAAFGNDAAKLYDHFLTYGIKEGRQASPIFSVDYYLSKNADLKSAFGSDRMKAYNHFITNGYKEARITAPSVDLGTDFYAEICNKKGGKNISINSDDNNVLTYKDTSSAYQTWKFVRLSDGSYNIINKATGLYMTVANGSYSTGANIHIAKSNGSNSQKWFIYRHDNGVYLLRSKASSCCMLSVKDASTEDNANIFNWKLNRGGAQAFYINKVGTASSGSTTTTTSYVNLGDNFNARIGYPKAGLNLSLIDKDVIIYPASSSTAQIWNFVRQSDGSYKIINTQHNLSLTESGSKINLTTDTGAKNQRWFIKQVSGGYQLICGANKDRTIHVANGSTESMTRLHGYKVTGSTSQIFTINKVTTSSSAYVNLGDNFKARIGYPKAGLNLSLIDKDVIIYPASSSTAQIWNFVRQSDGSYKIINTQHNLSLTESGSKINLTTDTGAKNQRWFIKQVSGGYQLICGANKDRTIHVANGSTESMTKLHGYKVTGSTSQIFTINKITSSSSSSNGLATAEQMAVIRKIIYAVETGGQVYGQADYTNFTEAYTNSSSEHAITIGAGQWYATEAKKLLNTIRSTDPSLFKSLDTAGIANDLDTKDWSTYKLTKGSAKAKCIQAIIGSSVGRACQDKLIDEQMAAYMKEAKDLGVKNLDAQMMCANIRHQGGYSAMKRVLGKTTGGYTLDNIYAAMQTDTGNQVGAYRSRQKMVYESLKKYL